MKQTARCPFCNSDITSTELAEIRENIAKAQDPEILRELESIRTTIRTEEQKRAETEVQAIRAKLDEYQRRERELDKRDAELKARAATIDSEVRQELAKREKRIREQAVSELSEKHKREDAERDTQIATLRHEVEKQKEAQETEVERRLRQKETELRQDEKQRVAKLYEPLQQKLKEYQDRETAVLQKEQALVLREKEVEVRVAREMAQKRDEIMAEASKQYEPLRLKLEEHRKREAEVLEKEEALALREQEVDLRVAREVSQKRDQFLTQARKQAEEKHGIELKEKEAVIANLQGQLDEAQRTIQSGSPQRRGDIQEEELADILERGFPEDKIVRIASGQRGADVLQIVRSPALGEAGSIYWESKRTKDYHPSWLGKLKQDQQDRKADVGALVSATLPDHIDDFGVVEGIVVLHPRLIQPVATLVRQYLLNIARQRLTVEQRETKLHSLFDYMTSNDFLQRVAAIVDAQARLTELNNRERRAHEKIWSQRDELQNNIGRNIAELYGGVEGIVGSLPPVHGLQLLPKPPELLPPSEDETP